MGVISLLCLSLLVVNVSFSDALKWSDSEANRLRHVRVCEEDDAHFNWTLLLTKTETIHSVKWEHQKAKKEDHMTLAVFSNNTFQREVNRIQPLSNAGFTIKGAKFSDKGLYHVTVNVRDSRTGSLVTTEKSTRLEVGSCWRKTLSVMETRQTELLEKMERMLIVNDNYSAMVQEQASQIQELKDNHSAILQEQAIQMQKLNDSYSAILRHLEEEVEPVVKVLRKESVRSLLKEVNQNKTSCRDWQKTNTKSGVRVIFVNGKPTKVYCDQDTDGGGWMVFQRRQDGSVDFYRGWDDYRAGFGDPAGEFWLGLDTLHAITASGLYQLRVDLRAWDGERGFATYNGFKIGDRQSKYTLTFSRFRAGTAGDSLAFHKGQNFTTYDQDNDKDSGNCAKEWHGAWWYNKCHNSNLNGLYKSGADLSGADGVVWKHLYGNFTSLKFSEMKIRPA